MTNFFFLLLIGSCWVWGINCLFSEGFILEKAGDWLNKKLPDYLYKPLVGCPPCQSSIHGLVIGLIFIGFHWLLPFYIVCLCGLNYVIKEVLYPEYE